MTAVSIELYLLDAVSLRDVITTGIVTPAIVPDEGQSAK
jgi:hypothetical protein